MKVLVLHSELGVLRGGGENFTRNLFTAFAERGHRVTAAFVANQRGQYPIPLPPCIAPIPLRGWWSRNLGEAIFSTIGPCIPSALRRRPTWNRLQGAISWRSIRWHSERFRRRVERELDHCWNNFDAIYVHSNTALASVVAKHRPTILRLPGPVTAERESQLRAVHKVCANGDALERIRTFLGDHAMELPIGVNLAIFRPAASSVRSELNWTERHRVIGYVGRLTHLKGADILSSAFRKVYSSHPEARLLIVGKGVQDRNFRSKLSQEIARGIVHMQPDVDHRRLPDWYRAMDILVMPSRYENFSNTLLEGMACGIPFLASDVGGNRILAKSGAGWLFQPESASSLALDLGNVLNDACRLKEYGGFGAHYVKCHHSWSASAQCLESIFTLHLGVH